MIKERTDSVFKCIAWWTVLMLINIFLFSGLSILYAKNKMWPWVSLIVSIILICEISFTLTVTFEVLLEVRVFNIFLTGAIFINMIATVYPYNVNYINMNSHDAVCIIAFAITDILIAIYLSHKKISKVNPLNIVTEK